MDTALGAEFTLSAGQSAMISDEGMKITFNKVVGDSRCPEGVTCIWAGVASCSVTIIIDGREYFLAVDQPGLSDHGQTDFMDYTVTSDLTPHPREGLEISSGDYRLVLRITK